MKYKPSITDSPAHFYNQIRRQAQYFSGYLLKVLQKNLQTNSSSAHPDNILVGMVACDDPVRREGAVMMILKIHDLPTIRGIREYILPKLFFKSSRQAQYFSGYLLKVLQKNLQTNSSSAHPDNILVGMVACDDPVRREGAVMMILKIPSEESGSTSSLNSSSSPRASSP